MFKGSSFVTLLGVACLGACLALMLHHLTTHHSSKPTILKTSAPKNVYYHTNHYILDSLRAQVVQNHTFVSAARKTIPSVVFIKTKRAKSVPQHFFPFFRYSEPESTASGSGVIISTQGYIVTNYHVIDQAEDIEVILNDNRLFEAKLIGEDPSTDLALLKIDCADLTPIIIGSSDSLQIGEWVLAVGSPFELRSTVTAGIVSAKARNIQTIQTPNNLSIESFIQTDAVVNRGNSGGALVNLKGELIGINTAIFTQTGAYEGYSFAVPASLVQKVTYDLQQYGQIQRAFLGVSIKNVDATLAKKMGIDLTRGVYVQEVFAGSSAAKGGLKKKDVITVLDKEDMFTVSQFQEKIGRKRPGDKVSLTILRGKTSKELSFTLQSLDAYYSMSSSASTTGSPSFVYDQLTFIPLSAGEKRLYGTTYGVKLTTIRKKLWQRMLPNQKFFIVTHINAQPIYTPEEAYVLLRSLVLGTDISLHVIYKGGQKAVYHLPW